LKSKTADLIAEMKALQDRKAAIEVAIAAHNDAETKARLTAERDAVADELRARKAAATRTPTANEALNAGRLDLLAAAVETISPCLVWRDSGGFASYLRAESYDATSERAGLFEVVVSLDGCNPDDIPAIIARLEPGGVLMVEMPVAQHDELFEAAGFERLVDTKTPYIQLWRLTRNA
jgi:hypothetical protein